MPEILLRDGLSELRDGPVHADLDPYKEFHAVADPPDANRDGWTTQISHWSLPDEIWWRVTDAEGRGWLESRLRAGVFGNMLMTKGDIDWQDCGVERAAQFLPAAPEARGGPRGVAFRCLTTQHYYAFVLDADGCFKILKRVEAGWDVLARSGAVELPAGPVRLVAEVSGSAIACRVEELSLCLEAVDHEYAHGRIGVIGSKEVKEFVGLPEDMDVVSVTQKWSVMLTPEELGAWRQSGDPAEVAEATDWAAKRMVNSPRPWRRGHCSTR